MKDIAKNAILLAAFYAFGCVMIDIIEPWGGPHGFLDVMYFGTLPFFFFFFFFFALKQRLKQTLTVFAVVTTIGFGDVTVQTSAGKFFVSFYAVASLLLIG